MNKEVLLPAYIDDFNALDDYWYPHPPCLIPLFLGHGASYKGITHNFFCTREDTYVEYFLEHGFMSEIARNADQFITLIILKMIIVKDALTPDILDFCKQIGYDQAQAVDQFTVDYGDDPKEFDHLPFFNQQMPFKFLKNLEKYDGDFPSSIYILNKDSIVKNASIFEIAATEQLPAVNDLPIWLSKSGNAPAKFQEYLEAGRFKEAWFTLNRKGWMLKELAQSLEALVAKSNDPLLALVAENWISGWKKSTFINGNL